MRVSSIRRARWQRGRAHRGAEGRWRPRFTGVEACWPGSAGWRGAESPAEECSHAPRQTCGRSERVAKRWRPRNARRTSWGSGARGRGRRPAARAGHAGGSGERGAPSWERRASEGAPRLPPCRPDAARSSAEPHPRPPALPRHPELGGVGAFARPRRVPPARDCPADVLSEVPEGVRKEPGGHEPRSAAAVAAGWTRCRPGRRGADGQGGGQGAGAGERERPGSSAWRSRAEGL